MLTTSLTTHLTWTLLIPLTTFLASLSVARQLDSDISGGVPQSRTNIVKVWHPPTLDQRLVSRFLKVTSAWPSSVVIHGLPDLHHPDEHEWFCPVAIEVMAAMAADRPKSRSQSSLSRKSSNSSTTRKISSDTVNLSSGSLSRKISAPPSAGSCKLHADRCCVVASSAPPPVDRRLRHS